MRRALVFVDQHQVGLADHLAAKIHHEVPGGLDVDGPPDHLHQLLAQRDQVRRDLRILVTQWPRVDARDEEAGDLVEADDLVAADERQVKVAGARTVRVECRVVLPADAR